MNGRDKLIEATRIYLQSNRKMSLTRTEIAQGCGVTPALISYYFKDKRSLLNAVAKPLLNAYHARLVGIFASQQDPRGKMRQVIRLLVELNINDGFLIDHMLRKGSFDELDKDDRVAVEAFQQAIAALVRDLMRDGDWRDADFRLAETALWGLCRAFGEALRMDADLTADRSGLPEAVESRIAFIYAMFAMPLDIDHKVAVDRGGRSSGLVQQ